MNTKRSIAILSLTLVALAACAVVSPPPILVHQDSLLRPGRGAFSVAAGASGGGGLFVDPFVGARGSLEAQVTPDFGIGLDGGGGASVAHDNRLRSLGSGRVYGVLRPRGVDWATVRFGLGAGGGNTGLVYATGDVGATFGWTFKERVRPYGGLALALSCPVRQGQRLATGDDDHAVFATFYLLPAAGVTIRLVEGLDLTLEGTAALGDDFRDHGIVGGAGSVSLRYTFDPSAKRL